ncbi:hypothetical protein [uncultured Cardiobacterium sp.]|uniref:hypothetical protein n=1 Tax=uncultured Cardiobacterium sp. TaxID=417619 RepID=UPI00260267C2|nr:hypothetical protein [uncultured Cardiobacterium sp.]
MRLLPTIHDARRFAAAILARHHLPTAPLVIAEENGCYGIESPACRMIISGGDGRILYLRGHH